MKANILLLTLATCALPILGQFEYGEILGEVRDSSGAVVGSAKVTLRSLETNLERIATSNEQGLYSFPLSGLAATKSRWSTRDSRTRKPLFPRFAWETAFASILR